MNILFLSDHLGHPEGRLHGASTYFLHVLPDLVRRLASVTVCFLHAPHPAAQRLQDAGVDPIFLNRSKWDPLAAADVVKLIREKNIELIHAAGMKGTLVARWAAHRTGAVCISHFHDANVVSPPIQWLQQKTAAWNDATICISRAVADFAVTTLGVAPDSLSVLYNPLPPQQKLSNAPADRSHLLDQYQLRDRYVVLVLGRLSKEKGHAELLKGGADWLRSHPDIVLWLVGDGEERDPIIRLAADLKIDAQIRMAGHLDEVHAVLDMADVLLIPSEREGLGYAALEAMAAGCPVVAFAVGGIPEIVVHEQTGLLAPPGAILELLQQVDRVQSDEPLRTSLIEGGQRQIQSHTIDAHVEQLTELYETVAARHQNQEGS